MKVEMWPVSRLVPYRRPLRKNDHAVAKMVASINQFGLKVPILVRGNEIVDGDLRLKAAIEMGLTEVPVILCDEWSDAQVKAFRLMVNRSATWAEWNMELVALEIQELNALDFDLALTGFDPPEIDKFLFGADEGQPDHDVPEVPEASVTQPGDLWTLDEHRVLCGDATSEEAVQLLLGSAKPVLMVTDPPYGVDYDPNWRERAGLGKQRQTGTVANDTRADWTPAYRLFPGDVAYVWHAGIHSREVEAGLEATGFRIRSQIIWAKQHFALSRGDYHWQHEPCWYAVREGRSSHWSGDRTQSTLWEVPNLNPIGGNRQEEATGHGTQKPLELMRRPIFNNSIRGDIVYDPFLGSGTTLIAAEETDRICYGLDIDPRYVDVTIRRWQNVTGKMAMLASTGQTFDQVAAERSAAGVEV